MHFQALHKTSLREAACTMRVCDVLLSLVATLIDLGLLANCRREEDTSNKIQQHKGKSTPPTSSNNIFSSPTKEIVYPVSNKRNEKSCPQQEAKKIEKEVSLENNIADKMPNLRDNKEDANGLSGLKEHVGSTGDKGGLKEGNEEKATDEEEDRLSHHNTFMDIVIR